MQVASISDSGWQIVEQVTLESETLEQIKQGTVEWVKHAQLKMDIDIWGGTAGMEKEILHGRCPGPAGNIFVLRPYITIEPRVVESDHGYAMEPQWEKTEESSSWQQMNFNKAQVWFSIACLR